ncbi:MAG: hypothetical protein LAQ30_02865 [Acidobacteriia bacterium]|nr:hypothetical protein [Terriglobia bacterium]
MNGLGHAALLAFLALARGAAGADDLTSAARELAQKSAAFAGKGEPVSASWRNLSSLGPAELARAEAAFEAALQVTRPLNPPLQARITLSENASQYLLVEEAQKGEERQVWFTAWNRGAPFAAAAPALALERKFLWEQEEQILDVAFPGDAMLILTPSGLVWLRRQGGEWIRALSVPLPEARVWPRDVRGRLRLTGAAYQAYLPGFACSGAWQPPASIECRPTDDPWTLESGSRAMLLANYAAGRNYFDGRIITQAGQRKTVPPFYSAAASTDQGRTVWLLAGVDGRTRLFDAAFDPGGELDAWGSDIAGAEARCGGGSQALATRPGDSTETDAVQAFGIVNRAAMPLSAPVEFPGPVTALWVSGGTSAVAVSKNLGTGRYEAYLLTIACGM